MTYKTGKKELILELLSKNPDKAFGIEEICASVLDGGRGKSTVYRLVGELVVEGLLRRLSEGGERAFRYQYFGGECHGHLHLCCSGCGALVHLDCEASHRVKESVMAAGFTLEDGAVLAGECERCRREGGKRGV